MSLHFLVNGRHQDGVQTGLTSSISPDGIASLSAELNSLQIQDSGILSGPSSGFSITNSSPTGHSGDPRSDVLPPVAVSDGSCDKLNQLPWWPASKPINPPPNKLIIEVPPSNASFSLQPVPPVIRPMLPSVDFTIPFSIPSPREEVVGWSPVNHFFQYVPQSPYTWMDGAVRFPCIATANMTVPPALPFVPQPMYFVPLVNQVPSNQPVVPIPPPPPLVQSWISGFPNNMTPPEEHSVTISAHPPRTSLHLGTPELATPTSFANISSTGRRLTTNGEPNHSQTGRRSGVDQVHSRSEVNKGKMNTGPSNSKSSGKKKLGFHNNILYKTELCHDFLVSQACPRGLACQYAHGEMELRDPRNHPLYKTTVCQDFRLTGTCVRGTKCLHLHPPETVAKRPQRPNSPCLARSTPKSGTATSA